MTHSLYSFILLVLIPLIFSSSINSIDYFTTTQTGQGTYYGNGDQGGACGLWPLPDFANSLTRVALNSNQYVSGHVSQGCGMCFTMYGTGVGSGATPIKGPIYGFVNNLCPECDTGSIDVGVTGDGRWDIYWTANDCPVGDTFLQYLFQGSNPWYLKVQVRNHRVPVFLLEFLGSDGIFHQGTRTSDNFWNANGFPYPLSFPLTVRVTSITGATVIDTIPSFGDNTNVVNGGNNVQLPSIKASTTPSTDTPSTDTPSTDTPSTDTPSTDTPSTDTPSTDTPSTDTPSTDTPSTDTPSTDTPSTDTPSTDTPSTDTPSTDTPSTDTPSTDTPSTDTPSTDTPSTDTPSTDTPSTDTPSTDTPSTDTPSTDTPSTDTPSTDTPSTDTPSTDTPSTDTPSTDTPSTDTPSTDTPSTDTPSTDTPSTDTPSTDTPSTDTPSTDTPSTDTPSTEPDTPSTTPVCSITGCTVGNQKVEYVVPADVTVSSSQIQCNGVTTLQDCTAEGSNKFLCSIQGCNNPVPYVNGNPCPITLGSVSQTCTAGPNTNLWWVEYFPPTPDTTLTSVQCGSHYYACTQTYDQKVGCAIADNECPNPVPIYNNSPCPFPTSILEDTSASSTGSNTLPLGAFIGIGITCGIVLLLFVVFMTFRKQRKEEEEIV